MLNSVSIDYYESNATNGWYITAKGINFCDPSLPNGFNPNTNFIVYDRLILEQTTASVETQICQNELSFYLHAGMYIH